MPTDSPKKIYAFILNDEVVWTHTIPDNSDLEGVNAIFSSDPKVVLIPSELGTDVTSFGGWKYINGEFVLNEE